MSTNTIESGIPIPPPSEYGKWTTLVKSMKVGDSVLVEKKERMMVMGAIYRIGKKSVTRVQPNGQVRVWLTEGKYEPHA